MARGEEQKQGRARCPVLSGGEGRDGERRDGAERKGKREVE